MFRTICCTATCFALWLVVHSPLAAQEPAADPPADSSAAETETIEGATTDERLEQAKETAESVAQATSEKVGEIAEQVDQSQQAQEARAGILKPIYILAEYCSFPTFHWVAFTLMVAGVVGYGLQLTLGKLMVLANRGFSLKEILSDAITLIISLLGLVLTTQAATENSSFTESAFAVLSATGVGGLVGFMLYVWGQRQELQAVKGRSQAS